MSDLSADSLGGLNFTRVAEIMHADGVLEFPTTEDLIRWITDILLGGALEDRINATILVQGAITKSYDDPAGKLTLTVPFETALPLPAGTPSPGVSLKLSRGDHVHAAPEAGIIPGLLEFITDVMGASLGAGAYTTVSFDDVENTIAINVDAMALPVSTAQAAADAATLASAIALAPVQTVNGMVGNVSLTKAHLGLGNVDNTSDLAKPISTATQTALDLKAAKSVLLTAGVGLDGGGDLSANRTFDLDAATQASLLLANSAVQPARTITAGTGLTGGGSLAADRTIALNGASIASLALADTSVQSLADLGITASATEINYTDGVTSNIQTQLDALPTSGTVALKADKSIVISAGTGLTGGGDLSANRTIALNSASIFSLGLADTSVQSLADLGITASAAEINFIDGVTSSVQTQLNGKQPLDTDLTTWAGITPAAGVGTFLATPSSANLRSAVTDETGTGALVFANSPALVTPTGIVKNDVGLGNVDNTSDLSKPISTATQAALDLKQPLDSDLTTWAGITPAAGVGTFLTTPSSANLRSAVTDETGTGALVFANSPALVTPTGIVKGDVGLGNVDNTSDATKNAAAVTLTNKTISLTNNTLSGSLAEFNTALTGADFVSIAGVETLTNKTLTTPTLTGTTVAAWGAAGRYLELNNAADFSFIDFHSKDGGASDYDTRIASAGGHASTSGQGTLRLYGNYIESYGSTYIYNNLTLQTAQPYLGMYKTGGADNEHYHEIIQSGSTVDFRYVNDLYTLAVPYLRATRSGISSASIELTSAALTWNGNTLFTTANDGAGSNFDADLLDGQHGAYYLNAANLTGSIADARLSANVALENITNTFTGRQIINVATQANDGLQVTNTADVARLHLYPAQVQSQNAILKLNAQDGNNVEIQVAGTTKVTVGASSTTLPGAIFTDANLTLNSNAIVQSSAAAYCPQVYITNTNDDANGPYLFLRKRPASDYTRSGDAQGSFAMQGKLTGGGDATGLLIATYASADANATAIPSYTDFYSSTAAGLTLALRLNGADVSIPNTLYVTTIGSGTWNGSTIGDAYLPTTMAGKTFSSIIVPQGGFAIQTKDDMTTRAETGFYQTNSATLAEGWPINTGSWAYAFSLTHANTGNYYALQFASGFAGGSQAIYARNTEGSGSTAWNKLQFESYTPAGTGAVARTIKSKLDEVRSVKDFNAAADGIFDDAPEIQAAIDAAKLTGGEVYLPAGKYILNSTLVISHDVAYSSILRVNIRGEGEGCVTLIANHTGPVLQVQSSNNANFMYFFRMSGLKIDGNGLASSCVQADNIGWCHFEDVSFIAANGKGFDATDVLSAEFTRCNFRSNLQGYHFRYSNLSRPNAIVMTSCNVGFNTTYGGLVEGAATFTLLGGAFERNGESAGGAGYGLKAYNCGVEGSVGVVATGVYFELNDRIADLLLKHDAAGDCMHVLTGCTFYRWNASLYATNNLLFERTASNSLVTLLGCGFKSGGTYTASSSRKYWAGPSGAIYDNGLGANLYQVALETPAEANFFIPGQAAKDQFRIEGTSATFIFKETDGTANNIFWDFVVQGETFYGRAVNDAYSSANSWLEIGRTNTTVDYLTLGATSTLVSGTFTILGGGQYIDRTAADLFGPSISLSKRGTTGSSTAAVASGTELGSFGFLGWDGTVTARGALVIASAAQAFTGSAHGGILDFYTTDVGATSESRRMRLGAGVQVGFPTGGDKGQGTVNAVGLYDDNTLVTDYVFDAVLDNGKIDFAKYDSRTPNREHGETYEAVEVGRDKQDQPIFERRLAKEAYTEERSHDFARKFAARLKTKHDPLTLDGYAAHWKEKRHLTSMPNGEKLDIQAGVPVGALVQRLVETVEIQAVLIEQLNQRLKLLEKA